MAGIAAIAAGFQRNPRQAIPARLSRDAAMDAGRRWRDRVLGPGVGREACAQLPVAITVRELPDRIVRAGFASAVSSRSGRRLVRRSLF